MMFEPAWTVERHSGKRVVFAGDEGRARAEFYKAADALRAGRVRLLQPDGHQERLVNAPRLRTRW
jgi:hypothetical protein